MKRHEVLRAIAAASVVAAVWPAPTAHAVCSNLGGVVTCTADDSTGFFSVADLTSITVNSGVTVSDTTGGAGAVGGSNIGVIELTDGFFGPPAAGLSGAFINNGTITDTGPLNAGVFIEGDVGGGFRNNGSISGADGVFIIGTVSGGFVNNGDLNGIFNGGLFLSNMTGGFTNTGSITSMIAHGVNALDISGGFSNSGSITGAFNGVDSLDIFGGFNNSGSITGAFNGVDSFDIFGGFNNSGSVTGTNNDGINTTAINGGFVNSGGVTGSDDAIDTGDISGGFGNTGTLFGTTGEGANINGSVTGGFRNSGAIRSGGSDGVDISGSLTGDFDNSGTISGSGPAGDGVDIDGPLTGNASNSGIITGTDDGFDVDGPLTGSFSNTGTVSATGSSPEANGVDLSSISGRFFNSGTIIGTNSGVAIEAGTIAAGFSNRGRIVGDSDENGIGDGVNIISAAGQSGVFFNEAGGVIIGAIGFHSEAGNEMLTNGGTITGKGGTSIDFGAGDDTLSLLPSSILIGLIDMGGGSNTLNVANGLNLAATFTGAVPGTINTNGAPLIINGNQVVVIDSTNFAVTNLYLGDLTTAIFNAVDGNSGGSQVGAPAPAALGYGSSPKVHNIGPSTHLWASGFGGYSTVAANSPTFDHSHGFGGAVAGVERRMSGDTFGFFGGGAQSRVTTDFSARNTEITTILGGVYYNRDNGSHWLNMILSGGWSDHDARRRIANNLAPTGIEFADSNYNGFLVAPALTVGMPIPNTAAKASLRVNYAGLFLNSYNESGATSALSIAGRNVHLAGARAQISVPLVTHSSDNGSTRLETRFGADGQFNLGSNSATAAISGASVRFATGATDRISGFLGADFIHTTIDGHMSIKASVEAQTSFNSDYEIDGQLKVTRRF